LSGGVAARQLWVEGRMGLVKTRRLAAMQKQQRAKAAMKPPMKGDLRAAHPNFASVLSNSRPQIGQVNRFFGARPKDQ